MKRLIAATAVAKLVTGLGAGAWRTATVAYLPTVVAIALVRVRSACDVVLRHGDDVARAVDCGCSACGGCVLLRGIYSLCLLDTFVWVQDCLVDR